MLILFPNSNTSHIITAKDQTSDFKENFCFSNTSGA